MINFTFVLTKPERIVPRPILMNLIKPHNRLIRNSVPVDLLNIKDLLSLLSTNWPPGQVVLSISSEFSVGWEKQITKLIDKHVTRKHTLRFVKL